MDLGGHRDEAVLVLDVDRSTDGPVQTCLDSFWKLLEDLLEHRYLFISPSVLEVIDKSDSV